MLIDEEPDSRPEGAGMVRVWVYQGAGQGVRGNVPLEEVSDLLDTPGALVWIDLNDPEPATLDLLREECALHPLAIEDAQRHHQRPKVDEYQHYYFIVFYVPDVDATGDAFELKQVSLFLAQNFLITVHRGLVTEIEASVHRWQRNADELGHNQVTLLYSLLDSLVDAYFPVVDRLGDEVDDVQDRVFEQPDQETLRRLADLRRTLLHVRRVLAPQREVINTLLRRDQPILPASTIPYFHDIYDHIVRLTETIDTHRDLLGTALDSYLSVTSNNLNQIMKTLTVWSIVLMSGALIAGIYGMNFALMPELEWPFGYPMALGLIVLTGILLIVNFRRRGWL